MYNPVAINQISDLDIHMSIPDDLFLEILLLKMRWETIKFASGLKNTSLIISLEKEIEQLEATCNETNINQLTSKKDTLMNLHVKELEASKVRSWVTWLKDSEKPS